MRNFSQKRYGTETSKALEHTHTHTAIVSRGTHQGKIGEGPFRISVLGYGGGVFDHHFLFFIFCSVFLSRLMDMLPFVYGRFYLVVPVLIRVSPVFGFTVFFI